MSVVMRSATVCLHLLPGGGVVAILFATDFTDLRRAAFLVGCWRIDDKE
jgi:hypothetical protein